MRNTFLFCNSRLRIGGNFLELKRRKLRFFRLPAGPEGSVVEKMLESSHNTNAEAAFRGHLKDVAEWDLPFFPLLDGAGVAADRNATCLGQMTNGLGWFLGPSLVYHPQYPPASAFCQSSPLFLTLQYCGHAGCLFCARNAQSATPFHQKPHCFFGTLPNQPRFSRQKRVTDPPNVDAY